MDHSVNYVSNTECEDVSYNIGNFQETEKYSKGVYLFVPPLGI